MRRVRLVLAGFGRVGQAFFRLVGEKEEVCRNRYGLDLVWAAILRSERALLFDPPVRASDPKAAKTVEIPAGRDRWTARPDLKRLGFLPRPVVLVECTPTHLDSGEPGLTHLRQALDFGWHAAAASKGALLHAGRELSERSRRNRTALKYSAATAAALPTLDTALVALAGAEIRSMEGILNGTTNFILTRIRNGLDYVSALEEAQRKGIAEPDPALDVEGWDTAAKLLLLTNAVFGTELELKDVAVRGIKDLDPSLAERGRGKGRALKLVGRCLREETGPVLDVGPLVIDDSHPLFGIDGTEKGLTFRTDTMDTVTVRGGKSDPRGAAAALLKDIINIFRPAYP